ncbi:MAG: GNAT family N-acetyltransferase [bacterium]
MPTDINEISVVNNEAKNQFEMHLNGKVAFLEYQRTEGRIVYLQTVVPQALDDRGIAARLARHALDNARAWDLKVVPKCPFVSSFIGRHPDYADLVEAKAAPAPKATTTRA